MPMRIYLPILVILPSLRVWRTLVIPSFVDVINVPCCTTISWDGNYFDGGALLLQFTRCALTREQEIKLYKKHAPKFIVWNNIIHQPTHMQYQLDRDADSEGIFPLTSISIFFFLRLYVILYFNSS